MFFPMMIDIEKMKILIVGGGKIAYRKYSNVAMYANANNITIVAKSFNESFLKEEFLKEDTDVKLLEKSFELSDLDGYDIVYAATDDRELNMAISEYCRSKKILVNSVDNHENSSFINMGIFDCEIDDEKALIGVSCQGKNPKLVKSIKYQLEEYFASRREKR